MNLWKTLYLSILDVLFPEEVPWQSDEDWQRIVEQLPRTEQMEIRGNITEESIGETSRFVRAAAFLWYEHGGLVQRLIVRGKFGKAANPEIFRRLTLLAVQEMIRTHYLDNIDVLIPVPLHPKRLRERGFNQSEIIAQTISEATGLPVMTHSLIRIRNNEHQANLTRKQRRQNAEKLFALIDADELKNKHILLIDDVITTGNTIHSCIKVLKHIRTCQISVFTLAKAR